MTAPYKRTTSTDSSRLDSPIGTPQVRARTLSDASAYPHFSKEVSYRELLSAVRVVTTAFFCDEASRCRAWGMSAAVFATMLAFSMVNLWFLSTFRLLQNALHDKDGEAFYSNFKQIALVCVAILPVVALRDGLKGSLALEWRRYLTNRLLATYISEQQAYYRLKLQGADIDNPDQRIGQDTAQFTITLPGFVTTVLQSVIVIVTQSGVLLTLDAQLFFFVVAYSLVMNVLTFGVFGTRLTSVNRLTLAQEASFRFGLVRVREHAESIAFYQGASFEKMRCGEFFSELMATLYHKLLLTVSFQSFNSMMELFISVLPYAIVAGKYLAGDMDFGAMSEASAILSALEGSFTILVLNLEDITSMGAQAMRIRQLWDTLHDISDPGGVDKGAASGNDMGNGLLAGGGDDRRSRAIGLIEQPASYVHAQGSALLRLDDVTLQPPVGQVPLVHCLSLELKVGESLLVCGPSGIGKSSILRAIGGLWASGCGWIERCSAAQSFFVPQEPYLCLGTLRDNCTYPGRRAASGSGGDVREPTDSEIKAALASVNMGYLAERFDLDVRVDLDTILSGGERQRLGFARLLLRPPSLRFAIMDEATSALDEANENKVYRLLQQKVLAFVSVGHRANLNNYHTHKLLLDRTSSGRCTWRFGVREDLDGAASSPGGGEHTPTSKAQQAHAHAEANERDDGYDATLRELDNRRGGFSDSWLPL